MLLIFVFLSSFTVSLFELYFSKKHNLRLARTILFQFAATISAGSEMELLSNGPAAADVGSSTYIYIYGGADGETLGSRRQTINIYTI